MQRKSDLSAPWLLDLWEAAPTPNKAGRIPETIVAQILRQNRIRRYDAVQVLEALRKEPVTVADGTTAAAQPHITTMTARIRLLNRLRHVSQARHVEIVIVIQHDAKMMRSEARK